MKVYLLIKDMATSVQSVLLPRSKFSLLRAKEWVLSNKYKVKKVDITENFFRFRQFSPSQAKGFRIKTLPDGIRLVLAV